MKIDREYLLELRSKIDALGNICYSPNDDTGKIGILGIHTNEKHAEVSINTEEYSNVFWAIAPAGIKKLIDRVIELEEQEDVLDKALTYLAKRLPFPDGTESWTESVEHWREEAIRAVREELARKGAGQ